VAIPLLTMASGPVVLVQLQLSRLRRALIMTSVTWTNGREHEALGCEWGAEELYGRAATGGAIGLPDASAA
jgi:hypothetical protein